MARLDSETWVRATNLRVFNPTDVLDLAASASPTLERLPLAFDPAARIAAARAHRLSYGDSDGATASGKAQFSRPEGSFAARSFGNVVHAVLETLAGRIAAGSSPAALLAELPAWTPRLAALLRADGLAHTTVNRLAREARTALEDTLRDPDGLWLLAPHAAAASEFALTAWPESHNADGQPAIRPTSIRVDRIFRAGAEPHSPGEDFLWIVDYKTSAHGASGLDDFLAAQRAAYAPQLETYARILTQLPHPARPARAQRGPARPLLPHAAPTALVAARLSPQPETPGRSSFAFPLPRATIFPMRPAEQTGRKRRDLAELCVGYALVLLVIWTPRPWQRPLYCAAAVFLAAVLAISFDGWKQMGLRTANFARSIWVVGAALLAAAVTLVLAGRMHTLQWPGGPMLFLHRYLGYGIWAIVQQALLQNFFLARLLRLMRGPGSAALAAAAIFSLAHLPNPILTAASFVWGLAACLLFLRYRNLYPLALTHAILGITLAMTVPGPVIRNMRVGLGYLTYSAQSPQPLRPHRVHQRVSDGGGANLAVAPPCPAVKDARQRGQHNVSPVEVRGALVEVGETEEYRRRQQRSGASQPPLQKVLHPSPEEQLFRHGDECEGEEKRARKRQRSRPRRMEVQKAQAQAKRDRNRRVPPKLAQPGADVAETQAQIEADAIELPHQQESIDSCIQQQHLIEDRKVRRPRALKPAQIDRQTQRRKHREIAPVAVLRWIDRPGLPFRARRLRPEAARTTQTSPSEMSLAKSPPAYTARTAQPEIEAAAATASDPPRRPGSAKKMPPPQVGPA